jgi:hypothetical protein
VQVRLSVCYLLRGFCFKQSCCHGVGVGNCLGSCPGR